MPVAFPNFEPIWLGLATQILAAANTPFVGDCSLDGLTITNIPDTSKLIKGIACASPDTALCLPGTVISSIDSSSQITLNQPLQGAATAGSFRAGTQNIDPMVARLLRHWSDMKGPEQPAIFVAQVDEDSAKRIGQPANWVLHAKAYVYCQAAGDGVPAAPILNAMLAALRTSLFKDRSGPGAVQNRQTLGGLVLDCFIEGRIETDEGYLGQQAVAIAPITIYANGP